MAVFRLKKMPAMNPQEGAGEYEAMFKIIYLLVEFILVKGSDRIFIIYCLEVLSRVTRIKWLFFLLIISQI